MVRKIDFVTGERLLQSFPYILLDQGWLEKLRKKTLFLAEKAHYYFQGTKADYSICSWQKKLIKYLEEQGRLPFPLFRLSDNWSDIFENKQFLSFQSARGENFQLPLYLSEDLAYLTGVIMGDGHLAEYFINIIDASKEHIENLEKLLIKLFRSKTEIYKQSNANAWNVNILGKWIVRFFNFLSGQPIAERKYPALREPNLFSFYNKTSLRFRSAFWRGLMDADGTFKSTIGFGTASKQLLEDFLRFLKQHEITCRLYTQTVFGGTTYSFTIAGESRKRFAHIIGTKHPEKLLELTYLLSKRLRKYVQRASTLLKQGYWKGQIIDWNRKFLIDGYFNLSFVSHLSITNVGSFIKSLRHRDKHTLRHLASKISTYPSLLSNYERNTTSIPISVLLKILIYYGILLQDFLANYSKLQFNVSNSHCQIATKPSNDLIDLLQGLQIKKDGRILLIGVTNYPKQEYRQKLQDFFSINIGSDFTLTNSVLCTFVNVFFILRD